MKKGTSKKILVVFLIGLITVLIGVSVFIAARLQETQAPPSGSASYRCLWCEGVPGGNNPQCPNPAYVGSDQCQQPDGSRLNCCIAEDIPDGPPSADLCPNSSLGNVSFCVAFNCPNGDTSGPLGVPDGQCTLLDRGAVQTGGSGKNCSASCGQVDYFNSGSIFCGHQMSGGFPNCGGGTTPPPPPPSKVVCGGACTTNADCAAPANGGTAVCNAGKCENAACPSGKTIPGANCDCSNLNSCGSPCGPSLGLCQEGSVCRYVEGNSCALGSTTYCVPTTLPTGWATANCVARDQGNSYVTINGQNPTVAQIQAACNPVTPPPPPAQLTVSAASVCPSGSTTPTATITWSPGSPTPAEIHIDNDNNWNNGYYIKTTLSGSSTSAPSGFTGTNGATGSLTLNSSTTYYVRSFYQTDGGIYSSTSTFTGATCQITVATQCIDLSESGSDPLASGIGNSIIYTLVYQNPAASDPYPNIRLRVGTSGSPQGRDANNTSSATVRPYNVTHDPVTSRYTYQFRWEAASTAGANVNAGTYNVRVLLDGTTELSTPSACTESITVSQTAVEEPLFTVIKSGAPVCESDGDAVVNYTITVTNVGSVPGTIDFVQDTYDAGVYGLGILPTGLNPAFGTLNTGTITWTGDNSQRTFSAGQVRTYTYSVRIPEDNVTAFSTSGLLNQAVVQYDTSTTNNNTTSFDLRTLLTCTTIPATGIVDDYKFILVGMMFIALGLIVFKFRIGNQFSLMLMDRFSGLIYTKTEGIRRKVMPYEESIMDEMERKRKN